jgi:hypothetical protein
MAEENDNGQPGPSNITGRIFYSQDAANVFLNELRERQLEHERRADERQERFFAHLEAIIGSIPSLIDNVIYGPAQGGPGRLSSYVRH